MSDASQTSLAYVEVTNFGDIPTSTPTLQEIPFSSESLKQTNQTKRSANINPSGRANQSIRTGYEGGGDISADFVHGDFDDFIRYSMRAASWSSEVTDTDTVYSMANADNSINRSSGSFITDGFTQYGFAKISGFTDAANNGYFRIVSVAATKMVLAGQTVADEAAGDTVTITQGAQIVDGVTLQPVAFEKRFKSNTNDFVRYSGVVGRFQLQTAKENQLTASFQVVAQREQSASATFGDGSNTADSGNEVLNSVDHVVAILENGVAHDANSINFTIDPKVEGRKFIGSPGNTSVRKGDFECGGDFEILYKDSTGVIVANKALNFTTSNLSFVVEDSAGNGYVFWFPAVKITNAERVAGGQNQDVVLKCQWGAEESTSEDAVVRIVRFPAP